MGVAGTGKLGGTGGPEGTPPEGGAAPSDAPGTGPFYLYVLECADGTLYTGYTDDVERRAAVHNAGKGAKYTRSRLPVRVLAQAEFPTKHQAMSAEFRFKRLSRDQKDALIARSCAQGVPFAHVLAERFGGSTEG